MASNDFTSTMTLQRKPRGPRLQLARFYPWLIVLLLAYFAADLIIIKLRPYMLPSEPPPIHAQNGRPQHFFDRSGLNTVTSRNVFAEDGVIPPPLVAQGQQQEQKDAAPVPSGLPLNLVGTLVHSNPEKSIATIEVKAKQMTLALRVGKDIPGIATLVGVERNKAIIRNLNNNRLEYIEIKQSSKLTFTGSKPAAPAATGKEEVRVVGQNRFEVNRSDVLKYTSDISSVLQQAAMQPVRDANGEIKGYKFLAIQPGSIYTQLGFQVGDLLKGVNGEKIDSPAKAMELYNALKTSSTIKIQMERDGRDQDNDYTVK